MQTDWIINQNTQEIYIIKIIVISIMTYFVNIKLLNITKIGRNILNIFLIIGSCIISGIIREKLDLLISLLFLVCTLSSIFSICAKSSFGYSLLINIISLSINHVLFLLAIIISYLPFGIFQINNEIVNLLLILLLYILIVMRFFKIKRIKNGLIFLNKNKNNEYFNLIILNISVITLFFMIVISNYKVEITGNTGIGLIISSILMFITIQKSLQLYYKQKMLVKDLEETKAELEEKKKEIEELEKENLNFSKVTHSIAHKQKSLEFKLNELNMKSEISSEIGDRIDKLGKELTKETISVIEKVGIEEIDDMLKYMQAECVKKKIDFQLQISGNIHTMINHYIDKEELEILLADHIKNAIIAIGCGDNVNKSILVRLGKLDGYYGLYIYDSGIEFEIETLYKLGKIPATTHKDNGGTGMGFMNTFDTLRKHKASLVIEEYGKPVKNNFTKALKFIFNGKSEFKIFSYRNEKIEKENKENDLVVEKLNI